MNGVESIVMTQFVLFTILPGRLDNFIHYVPANQFLMMIERKVEVLLLIMHEAMQWKTYQSKIKPICG